MHRKWHRDGELLEDQLKSLFFKTQNRPFGAEPLNLLSSAASKVWLGFCLYLVHSRLDTGGRNTFQIAGSLGDPSWIIRTLYVLNSPGLSQGLSLAGRCSDHNKSISPLPRCLAAGFDPSAPAVFLTREEDRSVLETAAVWPIRGLRPIPALSRLGKHASESIGG